MLSSVSGSLEEWEHPSEPCPWPEHPSRCQGKSGERVGRLEEKSPRGRSWHSSHPFKWQGNAQGKLPPAPASATTRICPWSIVPTAFVTFWKSFGWQQGIPTSDSFTPLGSHSKEPLVPPDTA